MERITLCSGTVGDGCSAIRLRLEDRTLVFYHSLNTETRDELDRHGLAMCKASTGVHAALGAPQGLKAPILALGAQTLQIREWGTSLRSGSVCVPLPT